MRGTSAQAGCAARDQAGESSKVTTEPCLLALLLGVRRAENVRSSPSAPRHLMLGAPWRCVPGFVQKPSKFRTGCKLPADEARFRAPKSFFAALLASVMRPRVRDDHAGGMP